MNGYSTMLIGASVLVFWVLLAGRATTSGAAGSATGITAEAPADDLQQQVVAAERRGLDALKKGDVAQFGRLTADEAVFVDDHGPATKAEVLRNVVGFTLTDYSMDDVRFVPVAANTGLISYKMTETGNSHGHDFSAQAYVSAMWTKRGNDWICLFSQETAVRKPPAAAGPSSH
jgi:hypothetical protein